MDTITGTALARIVEGRTPDAASLADVRVGRVTTHSRRIASESAFFALAGQHVDGHRFAAEALRNGATVVVARTGVLTGEAVDLSRVIEVDDPLSALHRLAAWWRSQLMGTVVAVVGSNGKTTTKDALAHLLGGQLSVYASPGSYNSQLGVPLAVLQCPRNVDVALFEIGVSDPGEMARLQSVVRPDHVVLTNVGQRWRSHFSSRLHQTEELLSICADLEDGGWALVPADDPTAAAVAEELGRGQVRRRGDLDHVPVLDDPRYERDALVVDARFPDGVVAAATVRTPSTEILADVEAALAAAWLLGASSSALLDAVRDYEPTVTRMEIWRAPIGATLIRDISTSDHVAVGSAIRAAKRVAGGAGRTLVVLDDQLVLPTSDMAEALASVLGDERVDAVYTASSPSALAVEQAVAQRPVTVPMSTFDSRPALQKALLEDLRTGDVALIQSSSSIGDLASGLAEAMAPTRLYLDLPAIEQNVSTFRRIVGPSVRLLGMVKALAYGTDGIEVARCLEASGIDSLGVSNADEGMALRRAGVTVPVLVMLGTVRDIDKMLRHGLTPVVYSTEMLEGVVEAARQAHRVVPVHVKVDTGMHRTGFQLRELEAALTALRDAENVKVEGLMTHFASADDPDDDDFTHRQISRFEMALAMASNLGIDDVIAHAASTAAAIRMPDAHFDMVRLGIGLYGIHPSAATRARTDLVPAFALVSRIVEVLEVDEGERIGYGGTYTVGAGGVRVGVVPAGYGDGVPRDFSNVGYVMVGDQRCAIVGRVSMDSMSIDLSHADGAAVGSDVLILGRRGTQHVEPEQLAETIGTIAYELMVRLGPRVQRILTRH